MPRKRTSLSPVRNVGKNMQFFSVMVQDDEEMACTSCNSLFRLRISNNKIEPYVVTPATGAPLGPAEGRRRQ